MRNTRSNLGWNYGVIFKGTPRGIPIGECRYPRRNFVVKTVKTSQRNPWRNVCGNDERIYGSNLEKNSGTSLGVICRNFAWEILG